jgi:tetratricopeptide (TPR) repeat protein
MLIRALVLIAGLTLLAARSGAHGVAHERIAALTASIDRTPANMAAVIERADLYREIGEFSLALADYDRALRLDPAWSGAHLGRALVLIERDDFCGALAAADTFLVRAPDVARAWRIRAQALIGLHHAAEAIDALDRAIRLADPPPPDDYIDRARMLASLGDSHLDEAIAGLDAGLTRVGPAVTLQHLAIDLERRRGTFDAALARLDGIRAQYARSEAVLDLRGDILAQAGRRHEAAAAYHDALRAIEERRLQSRTTPASERLHADLLRKLETMGDP